MSHDIREVDTVYSNTIFALVRAILIIDEIVEMEYVSCYLFPFSQDVPFCQT